MTGGSNGRGRVDGVDGGNRNPGGLEAQATVPGEAGTFLFIGGSLDGEQVPVANPDSPVWIPVRGTARRDEYRPMFFRVTPQREHIVYAIVGMCADNVLDRLIHAYPAHTAHS